MNRSLRASLILPVAAVAAAAALLTVLSGSTAAQSAELHVMISDGVKAVVEEITPQLEKTAGCKLAIEFNSSKNLRDKIQAGEPFDAAILTADVLDGLIQQGKLSADGRADIARTGIGLGVRAGAPKPDIATPDALKKALLSAKSIGFNPTGASAAPTFKIFERLGIADEVKPKLMLESEAGRPQKNVAEGKTELVISLVPEIKFFPGVDLVGPMPTELQSYVNFAAAVSANTKQADAAKRMIDFLNGPRVAPVLKSKGMERPK